MLDRLTPFQFDRPTGSGRTQPARLTCEDQNGAAVEVVAKLSASCDRGVTSLAMEATCALLAGDLGLPIPQPYVVELDPEWIATVADRIWAVAAARSVPAAFGSRNVSPGFPEWIDGTPLSGILANRAAAIFVFDAVTDNADRRSGNPNCFLRGDEFRIIDHELAFPDTSMIIGWRPPWIQGGLHHFERPGAHIFRAGLKALDHIEWGPIGDAWRGLSDEQVEDYAAAMPPEWSDATKAVATAIQTIKTARDHIDDCIAEARRVLR